MQSCTRLVPFFTISNFSTAVDGNRVFLRLDAALEDVAISTVSLFLYPLFSDLSYLYEYEYDLYSLIYQLTVIRVTIPHPLYSTRMIR